MRSTLVSVLLVVGCVALWACDDDEPTDVDADVAEEVDVGDDDAVVDGDVEDEEVVEGLTSFEVEVRMVGRFQVEGPVVEGVTVITDKPGGERVTGTTDSAGRVTVTDLDWTSGDTLSITAIQEGHSIHSSVGNTEESLTEVIEEMEVAPMYISPLNPTDRVEVSGSVTNLDMIMLLVSPSVPGTLHQASGDEYSVQVKAGVPFSLFALQFSYLGGASTRYQDLHAWTVVERDAITEDTTVNIDLSNTYEATPYENEITIPDHWMSDHIDDFIPYSFVRTRESDMSGFIGVIDRRVRPIDAGHWEISGEYIDLESVTRPVTYYFWLTERENSAAIVDGFPTDGAIDAVYPEPVTWTSWDFRNPHELYTPFTWEMNETDLADADLRMTLNLRSMDGVLLHQIGAPSGTTSVTVPALPDGLDPVDVYGSLVEAQVLACVRDEDLEWCRRFSHSRTIPVEP